VKFASAMSRLGTETAFEVLARARALEAEGRNIIHLEIGEPDFDTPANVVRAGIAALEAGQTHYTPAPGIPALREAIARDASTRRGIKVDPGEVVVTPGGKPVMFFSIMALVEPGDEVVYPNPGFPIYESMANFVGGKAVPIKIDEARDFSLDAAHLCSLIGPRTRLVIINSPSNPTGGILTRADLEMIASTCLQYPDVMVLSDEIYSRMLYEGEHVSIASLPGMRERTIILDGFSKTYAMTGWRLGYGIMPSELGQYVTRLMTNSNSCTATFTQLAGVEALTGPQDGPAAMLEEFRARRELIVNGLNAIPGISCRMPHGAFYAFPNITGTGMSSREVADLLLQEAGVAVLSGTSFGAFGEGYVRLSYANSRPNIQTALDRVANTLAARWTATPASAPAANV
jgi:aspartate/methionine/tyrosine aminotransferase